MSMTIKQIFKFEDSNLTVIKQNDVVWFRGKSVASILEYTDLKQAIRKNVDSDDKMKLSEFDRGVCETPLSNNEKNTIYINESGLYSLILRSKLEKAKQFKRWVTKDVLPTIRKTGKYDIETPAENRIETVVDDEMKELIEVDEMIQKLPRYRKHFKLKVEAEYIGRENVKETKQQIQGILDKLSEIEKLNYSGSIKNILTMKLLEHNNQKRRPFDMLINQNSDSEDDDDDEYECLNWIKQR